MKYFLFEAKEGTFIDGGFYLQQFHAIYSSQQKRSMVDNFYGREGAMGKRIFSLAFRVKWTPRESSDLIDYRHRASRFSGPSHQTTLMALIANKFRTMRMIWEVIESPVYNKNWRTAEPEQGWSSWLKLKCNAVWTHECLYGYDGHRDRWSYLLSSDVFTTCVMSCQ